MGEERGGGGVGVGWGGLKYFQSQETSLLNCDSVPDYKYMFGPHRCLVPHQ